MQTHLVESLNFSFPDDWSVSKYDEWSFYRNQFGKMKLGIKALDLIAVSPDRTVWLIEVKDYRTNIRTKPSDLADEICQKIFDTLAAMIPAKLGANENIEVVMAQKVLAGSKLRVVLHLEQPSVHSKLFPQVINPSVLQMKIRSQIKPIDAHPRITASSNMAGCIWTVS